MGRYRFFSGQILVEAYPEQDGVPAAECCCLSLLGFPATIGENAFTRWASGRGFLVLQPHYPGTYDSDGLFTPATAVESISTVVESVVAGRVKELKMLSLQSIPRKICWMMGHSFGAFIALRTVTQLQEVERLFLFSPALTYGPTPLPSGFKENGPAFLEYVSRSRPHTYRLGGEDEWTAFYRGAMNQPALPWLDHPSLQEVIGIVGGRDRSFDKRLLHDNFERIVRSFVGSSCEVRLLQVPDGKHSLSSLCHVVE